MGMFEAKEKIWEQIFFMIEAGGDKEFLDGNYYNAKNKILLGKYKEVDEIEFRMLYNALYSSENNYHNSGNTASAYLCRRIIFHADEEGFYEFGYLKRKYYPNKKINLMFATISNIITIMVLYFLGVLSVFTILVSTLFWYIPALLKKF